uniref:hypothetical protein n=1 Tax=Undibacterium luofuense TaxID=2828733 RepID=UPI0030EC3319
LGRLQADIRAELPRGDEVDRPEVALDRGRRVWWGGDRLAEDVDGDREAGGLERLEGDRGLLERLAGDEAADDPPGEREAGGEPPEPALARCIRSCKKKTGSLRSLFSLCSEDSRQPH